VLPMDRISPTDRASSVDAVVAHLVAEGVIENVPRMRDFAGAAYEPLAQFEPVEVAEAEWQDWPADNYYR
jgi:hypothetical protein